MTFEIAKFLIYTALVILGYRRFTFTKERKYLLIGFLGALYFATNLLDEFVFTSNLELLAISDIITVGITFLIFHDIKQISISKSILWMPYIILVFYAIALFRFNWTKTDNDLLSNYGYLNTSEYSSFSFLSAILCLIVSTYIMIKTLQISEPPLNLIFIVFGIILFHVGSFLQFGLGEYFFDDLSTHYKFLEMLIPVRLFTSRTFILLGIIWKN